jgi:hypothetical protein
MNCLVTNNFAGAGGGIFSSNARPKFYNCTVINNSVSGSGGGFYRASGSKTPTVENCIFWDNLPNQIFASDPINLTYSDIQGGWSGTGNIDADPSFVDAASNDYHLCWNSQCINKGDPAYTAGEDELDIDSEPRIMRGRIDMGFDEVGEKQADLNRNGVIDFEDVEKFVQAWLNGPGDDDWYILCDLYQDGQIDFADWVELAKDWLWQAGWYEL